MVYLTLYRNLRDLYTELTGSPMPEGIVPPRAPIGFTRTRGQYIRLLRTYFPDIKEFEPPLTHREFTRNCSAGLYDTMDKWLDAYGKLSHSDRRKGTKIRKRRALILKDGAVYVIKLDQHGKITYKKTPP